MRRIATALLVACQQLACEGLQAQSITPVPVPSPGAQRFALLFKPGSYKLDASVGFYTQFSGLGLLPDEVTIDGGLHADARWKQGNATLNFWRTTCRHKRTG